MTDKLTRRQLLKLLGLVTGSSVVACTKLNSYLKVLADTEQDQVFLPFTSTGQSAYPSPTPEVTPTPTSKVVHVHSSNATNWNLQTDYWNYVNQATIDSMVDQGMIQLTGAGSVPDAWRSILPNYQQGQGIAIKVSFNNTNSCDENSGEIDSVIEPVNAIIRGLLSIGIQQSDIWIYETIRALPYRFVNACNYNNVVFFDNGSCGRNQTTFSSNDPNAVVQFSPPSGNPPTLRINDVLIDATYLINMPIMKRHSMAGVSLAFKNHYGTTQKPDGLHIWSSLDSGSYSPYYSPFIDIYNNPHVGAKTILTIGDGLFSTTSHHHGPPRPWQTFGNQVPNSLFFSKDTVATDCVMTDLLTSEFTANESIGDIDPRSGEYLILAENAGFGTYERGDPWANPSGSGYNHIDYQKIEL